MFINNSYYSYILVLYTAMVLVYDKIGSGIDRSLADEKSQQYSCGYGRIQINMLIMSMARNIT